MIPHPHALRCRAAWPVLGAVLLASGTLSGCGRPASEPAAPAAPAEAAEYTCSMHPQIRQPKPGRCPLCGMDLIPVAGKKTGADARSSLTLSDEARALASVETAPVTRRAEPLDLRFLGRLTPDPARIRQVTLLTEGRIEQLHVNYRGAPVKQGQPVAAVYSPEVLAASREWLSATEGPGGATNALAVAAREKLALLGVGSADLDRTIKSRQPLTTFTIASPADGTATEIMAQPGQWMMRGMAVVRLDDLSALWMEVDVTEGDLARVRAGQAAVVTLEALPGKTFQGEVAFPQQTVDADARVMKARVVLQNPDGSLMPGMFGRAVVRVPAPDPPPLMIPATAPLLTGRRAVVYVADPAARGVYEGRDVELGERRGDWYEVKSGLSEGESVVVRGAFQIDSAVQIEGRPSMMTRTPPPDTAPSAAPAPARPDLAAALGAYLSLAERLAADDIEGARKAAAQLAESAKSSDTVASKAAAEAGSAKGIEALRTAFDRVSAALISEVRKSGSPLPEAMDVVHCPMAFNNRGADWIQRKGPVRNPYFGAQMLECGEVTESIPPARAARP